MAKPKYFEWRQGYPGKIDAGVAAKELARIKRKHDALTADIVLNEATNKDNPLNPQVFDVDRSAAARAHYRHNALQLINSIVVVFEDAPEIKTRVYQVRLMEKEPETKRSFGVFESTEEMLKDPEGREILLDRAVSEALSWQKRHRELTELAVVFRAIAKVTPDSAGRGRGAASQARQGVARQG